MEEREIEKAVWRKRYRQEQEVRNADTMHTCMYKPTNQQTCIHICTHNSTFMETTIETL